MKQRGITTFTIPSAPLPPARPAIQVPVKNEITIAEVSPPGWSGTTKAMKSEPGITNPWALCLTGDTKVPLLDGRVLTMEELVEQYGGGGSFWVYSFDIEKKQYSTNLNKRRMDGFFAPGEAHHPRISGRARILKVTLDNGEFIRCTPRHPFMLHDGSYIEASELKPGMALRPLKFRLDDNGYQEFDCGYGRWHKTHLHVLGYNKVVGERNVDGTFKRRKTVHHANFNKLDNSPDNLEIMTFLAHMALHSRLANNWRDAGIKALTKWREDNPEKDREMRQKNGRVNGRKHQARHLLEYVRSSTGREKARENLITYNISDEHKERIRQTMLNSPERVQRMQEAAHIASANVKRSVSRERWRAENPEIVAATMAAMQASQTQEDLSRNSRWGNHLRWHERPGAVNSKCNFCEGYSNHKVISVVQGGAALVYDLSVNKYNNFALAAEVFVHNSWYMKNKGDKPHYPPEPKKARAKKVKAKESIQRTPFVMVSQDNGQTILESNPGHKGRPGEVGGSAPGKGKAFRAGPAARKKAYERQQARMKAHSADLRTRLQAKVAASTGEKKAFWQDLLGSLKEGYGIKRLPFTLASQDNDQTVLEQQPIAESYPGHKGVKGRRGGSAPKGEGTARAEALIKKLEGRLQPASSPTTANQKIFRNISRLDRYIFKKKASTRTGGNLLPATWRGGKPGNLLPATMRDDVNTSRIERRPFNLEESFPGHKGRKGHKGGSAAKGYDVYGLSVVRRDVRRSAPLSVIHGAPGSGLAKYSSAPSRGSPLFVNTISAAGIAEMVKRLKRESKREKREGIIVVSTGDGQTIYESFPGHAGRPGEVGGSSKSGSGVKQTVMGQLIPAQLTLKAKKDFMKQLITAQTPFHRIVGIAKSVYDATKDKEFAQSIYGYAQKLAMMGRTHADELQRAELMQYYEGVKDQDK